MSPSNSGKSDNGDPPSYQRVQQALFKVVNTTDNGDVKEIEPATAAEGQVLKGNNSSKVSSRLNAGDSNVSLVVIRQPNDPKAHLGTQPVLTSTLNPFSITPHQQHNISQRYCDKPSDIVFSKTGDSEGTAGSVPVPVVTTLGGTKPIKPKPILAGTEGIGNVISIANKTPMLTGPTSIAAATKANHLPPTKLPERISTNTAVKNKGTARRRGKWTVEEEEYVARVIQDFNSGFLNAPAGYTLRSYLSDKLQCDPMRITKKFTGESCIGKRVFHPAVRSAANATSIDKAQVRFLLMKFSVIISLPSISLIYRVI